jgi:hypothetical protein
VKQNMLMEREWVGSPSTFKNISFSSTANKHVINDQEVRVGVCL